MSKVQLALVVISLLVTTSTCTAPRIINGIEATEVSEYTVEVIARLEFELLTWGGGTLIAPNVVLTDAKIIFGYTDYLVRFGSWTWGGMEELQVFEAVHYPSYDPESQLHDIGLLRLAQSVDTILPGLMRPVQLYRENIAQQRVEGLLQGFGITDTQEMEMALILKNMIQTVIPDVECRDILGSRSGIWTETHFCAIDRVGNASACIFDEGNGFIVNREGVNYVVGVLSLITNMCRPEFPSLFIRVSDYLGWIEYYIELWK